MTLLRAIWRLFVLTGRSLRGRDMPLHAAAVTFYGGIAVVPVALLTIRMAALLAGTERVRRLTAPTLAALPDAIGADRAATALVSAGVHLGWVGILAAVLPASLYGEGLRRAFVSLADTDGGSFSAWRGRLLVLPLLAAGPGLLLALLTVLPYATGQVRQGGWASVGGVIVSFLAGWILLTVVVVWIYRGVGPGRPALLPTILTGSFTAANVSGFVHGFVLFCALPLDLGVPFGGFTMIGGVVAVALWLYLFHTVVLLGYAFTLSADRAVRQARTAPASAGTVAAIAAQDTGRRADDANRSRTG